MTEQQDLVGNDRYALPARSLPGGIYCAPWCGLGCTRAEYDRAFAEADALAVRLGAGWVPHVWENTGWNYSACKGVASVSAHVTRTAIRHQWTVRDYTAIFNSAHQIVARAKTPEDALGFLVQDARGVERAIAADLAALLTDGA